MDEHDFSSKIDSITPSSAQLRALTHPIRLRLLGLLRIDGPQTASDLARRTGLNTGSTSYHLRMLAKNGFIEKDQDRSREENCSGNHRTPPP
jgi:DNA-binding MarR family transcriptional regulator